MKNNTIRTAQVALCLVTVDNLANIGYMYCEGRCE